jgi:segregation and condensation protein B
MLFVGDRDNRPLTAARAAELMRGVDAGEIHGLVQELNRRYKQSGCPYFVAEDSDGYRITLRKPFHPLREQFYGRVREARLSQAAIDVLAIVAYQQPLSAEQISAVRGTPSSAVLSQLVSVCPASGGRCSTSPPIASCSFSVCKPWPTCRRARNSIGSNDLR